jgi:1-acyl-sn-glycerol-3-phosphate acyltransferase
MSLLALHPEPMNPLKKIACTLFAIYAILFTAVTVIIVVPAYLIIFNVCSRRKAPRAAHRLSQLWARVLFTAFFIRLKVKNRDLVDKRRAYVMVSNHRSQLDIPAIAIACRNTFRFLAKAELVKIPLLGYIIKNLYLTVDRHSRLDRSKSIELMKSSLDEGISVVIYPEGTRNRTTGPLIEFRDGAFRLAIEAQAPLAVLTILNMTQRNSAKDPFVLCPGRLYAVWDIIETKGLTQQDMPVLKEQARQIMISRLGPVK